MLTKDSFINISCKDIYWKSTKKASTKYAVFYNWSKSWYIFYLNIAVLLKRLVFCPRLSAKLEMQHSFERRSFLSRESDGNLAARQTPVRQVLGSVSWNLSSGTHYPGNTQDLSTGNQQHPTVHPGTWRSRLKQVFLWEASQPPGVSEVYKSVV